MDFGILGTLEVRCDGRPVELRRAKQRALLSMLLLHPNQVVSCDQLVDALWGDQPPESAANTLHGYVSHVRRALAGDEGSAAGGGLQTRSPGYLLAVEPSAIDAWRFERLVAQGRQSLASSDPGAAVAAFESALSLWRGPALADLPCRPVAVAEAARLEELRLTVLEERNVAELALGHHGEMVGRLQALVGQHPLRERLWGQLMLALYRCGRQAEALRTFSGARRLLRDELGIDPSPALRGLESEILAQAPSLDWQPAAHPVPVATPSHGASTRLDPSRLRPELEEARWAGLAGRIADREQLLMAWKEAAGGRRQLALVAGEAGIGKTRLVSELAADASEHGARVVYGRSDEELEAPYRPFVEALNQLVREAGSAADAPVLQADLSRLVPGFREGDGSRADPETERLRLFNAVATWLHDAAEETGLLLVLDDLHWADRSSLLLLRHLVTCLSSSRLMIVGTFRDTDVNRGDPLAGLLAEMRRVAGVQRITLGGLDGPEIEAMLADRAGGSVADLEPQDLARLLRTQTDGNPFFIGEVVSHLVEAGAIYEEAGRWRGDPQLAARLRVPEGVREVVGRRLSALAPEANEVLACAAIVGAEFEAGIVATVLAMPLDGVVEHLELALARRLVVDVEGSFARYRFAHALVRRTLDEELSSTRRIRLHHRIALALEEAGAAVTEIAHHFTQAAPMAQADAEKAVAYTRQVAREAAERLALDEAVEAMEIALATERLLRPDPARRALLLLGLGEAKNASGRVAEGRADFLAAAETCRGLDRPDLLARAAVGYAGALPVWVEYGEAAGPELAAAALAALPPEDSVERVLCMAKLSVWHTPSPDATARLRLTADALAMAERLGHPRARTSALVARIWAVRGQPGGSAEQLVLAQELNDLARATGNALAEAMALAQLAPAGHSVDDDAAARRALAELEALAERTGLQMARWMADTIQSALALSQGRFDELPGLDERERAPGLGELGQLIADGHQHLAAMLTEDWDAFVAVLTMMLERYPVLLGGWGIPVRIAWAQGDGDRARSALASWPGDRMPTLPAEVRFVAAAYLARPAADLRVAEVSQILYDILEPHRGTWCATAVTGGFADHALGLLRASLGHPAEGRSMLRAAVEAYRRAGARAWLAVALADLAELADDPAEARQAAAEAASTASAIGAPNVARRAMAACGAETAARSEPA